NMYLGGMKVRTILNKFKAFLDWLLFSRMSEQQRKKISNLIPSKMKNLLKKFSKSYQHKHIVNQYKNHLYTLGFANRALQELLNKYDSTEESYLKRLLAWELTL